MSVRPEMRTRIRPRGFNPPRWRPSVILILRKNIPAGIRPGLVGAPPPR